MAARSRKRGHRSRPPRLHPTAGPAAAREARSPDSLLPTAATPGMSRSQRRDAEARAQLEPLAPGERPWPVMAGAAIAFALGLTNFALFLAGVKPHVSGQQPKLAEILVFTGLMLMCGYGMWRLRYWAVLGFQTLLAIGLLGFSLALVKVQSLPWALAGVAIIGVCGYLFWKLVRVLGRIQTPTPPSRS